MKKRYIQTELLFYLSDGLIHTASELADKIEVSEKTIRRYLQDLSISYPINTYSGGYCGGGGYQLNVNACNILLFTKEELWLIITALDFLVENEEIRALKNKLIHLYENKKNRREERNT